MVIFTKQRLKMIICTLIICCTSIIIYMQMRPQEMTITEITKDENKGSRIQIRSNLASDCDVKLYEKTEENDEFTEVNNKQIETKLLKKQLTFETNAGDKAKPDNVTNLNTAIIDDYIIISFNAAKDNGTEYEYYIQGDKIQSKVSKVYKESGIKGYSYIIDNNENTQAGFEVNKRDSEPILYTKIQWNKNYYLHIRTIDNSGNFSDSLTYKILLPSKGLRMQYINLNSYSEISPEETIIGNANDTYNIKEYNKQLNGYTLVNIDGEETGKLKKERTNVKYMYAKNSNVIVRHLDSRTGKEIANNENILGYEGKEFKANKRNFSKYIYNNGEKSGKMKAGEQEIKLYYDEIGKVSVSYKNYITKEDIIPKETIKGIVETGYTTKAKQIKGYEIVKQEGETSGNIKSEETYLIYYYKKKTQMTVKHVDIDTNKVIFSEIIKGYEGEKIKTKSKKFEGYILKDNYSEYENKLKKQKEKIKDKNIESKNNKNISKSAEIEVCDEPKNANSIIDEILEEEELEITEESIKIQNTIRQYDIVMDCGKTEYIIYYKKI